MESLSPVERRQIGICIANVQSLKVPPLLNPNWDLEFDVNLDDMSKDIADQLRNGKVLNPRDKREFVRFMSNSITNICRRPKKKNLVTIIQKVVNKYPKSLADAWCDETASIGFESLLRRVSNRIDNLNRISNDLSFEKKKQRTPSYKYYGCTNWQPSIYASEEIILEQKRNALKDMYAKGTKTIDQAIGTLMADTYKSQRRDINEDHDIGQLMTDWPFLFTIEGLLAHFKELVGIDLRSKLENALLTKGNHIIPFMSKFSDKSAKKDKLKDSVYGLLTSGVAPDKLISDVSGILILIIEYFEERRESFYINFKNSVTREEVERLLLLQCISSPFIIVIGPSVLSCKKCMLCVGKKVVIEAISSFKDAFLGLFCLYYCLNIGYPVSAESTLEFVQKCFFGINPEFGTKFQKRPRQKMNLKATRLMELLSEQG